MPVHRHAIGGVFPLHKTPSNQPVDTGEGPSILQSWPSSANAFYCFHNARSALSYVLNDLKIKRVWLPAYLCPEILQATASADTRVSYYPLGHLLDPKIDFLSSKLRAGDALLTINFFGRPPSQQLSDFITSKPETLWIEDCAQTINGHAKMQSDIRVYSPRKLLGAPDGGILIDKEAKLSPPSLTSLQNTEFARAYMLRAEDVSDKNNEAWFAEFQKTETAHKVSYCSISKLSHNILSSISIEPIVRARKENYSYLHKKLQALALFPDWGEDWVPLCFPIISKMADKLNDELIKNRVFAPRYWRNLPSPQSDFAFEHGLSEKLIGLPCDQRYGVKDMQHIVSIVEKYSS